MTFARFCNVLEVIVAPPSFSGRAISYSFFPRLLVQFERIKAQHVSGADFVSAAKSVLISPRRSPTARTDLNSVGNINIDFIQSCKERCCHRSATIIQSRRLPC